MRDSPSVTEPHDYGNEISEYQILIYSVTLSDYAEFDSLCNGADTTIKDNTECTIEMTSFTTTLGYTGGEVIKVKAQALNAFGWSDISDEGSDATIVAQVPPTVAPGTLTGSATKDSIDL